VEKFRRLGLEEDFAVFEPPAEEKVQSVMNFFAGQGFKVKRGG